MSIIIRPFAWLLLTLYEFAGNYGLAIILFSVVVKLILLPFQMKSKRSMMRMNSLGYKVKELEKKHEGNQRAYSEAVQSLYRSEGVNPMSGCLWALIPFPILIALYTVIRQPLTHLMRLAESEIALITDKLVTMGLYTIPEKASAFSEIPIANLIHENFEVIKGIVPNVLDIDFSFLMINLGDMPSLGGLINADYGNPASWMPAVILFLIPFISAGISYLSMAASNKMNPQMNSGNAQQQRTMKYTMLMMPLVSVYICFTMPSALGLYWIAQGFFSFIQDVILNKYYKKKLAAEQAVRDAAEREKEAENELKRLETERLRAEGKTSQNANKSKKRIQALEKARDEERRAAIERAEKEERRKRLGIEKPEPPESQVGNRRYARGRAFVEDRFENPEGAEAATLAASEESEFGESIDDTIPEAEMNFADEAVEQNGDELTGDEESFSEADVDPEDDEESAEKSDDENR